jgi:hypothetical protein
MWFLSGHVSVEFIDPSVPFNSIEGFAIERKDTLKLYAVT